MRLAEQNALQEFAKEGIVLRTAILGCGAMGTVLGAFLARNGCPVDMIDSYREHVDALNREGAHIVGTVDFTVPVNAVTPEEMEGIYDVVFLFTKQTANDVVLSNLLSHLGPDSTVCTLQNGVPEPYVASRVGKERTVGGTVLWGATFVGPGVSELTQDLSHLDWYFDVGEMDGRVTARIQAVKAILDHMGPTQVSTTLMATRWAKLINNACMSGMSAACGATFGEVLDNDRARACLSYLAREVKTCCEAEGYAMPILVNGFAPDSLSLKNQEEYNASQQLFHDMYQMALPGKASMLQDLEHGRKTEVAMINGYVSQVGRAHGIATPFNNTVVEIVQRVERGQLPLSMDNLRFFDDSWFTFTPYGPI